MKKRLDELLINRSVQKLQMEKFSREARNDVEERMNALNLWEKAVARTQNRGEELDALLWSVDALSRRVNAKTQERHEKECSLKNAVRDTLEQTARLEKFEKHLGVLRGKRSSLRTKMENTDSQLKMIKVIIKRSGITISSLRSNIRETKATISSLTEKLNATLAKIEGLRGKKEKICANKVSIDQLLIEAEHRLQEEERNAVTVEREIENLCRIRFNISQEQKSVNNERLRIENVIRNCNSELKKLNNQICIEEEKVTHQERTIYDQDLKILQIESRLSKLQDEISSEEIEDYQEGIQHLSTELERLSKVQRELSTELEVLQVDSKQTECAFKKLLIEKAAVDSRSESDAAYVEQAENSMKKCKNEYNKILVEKNMLQLKIRRIDESLRFYNEKIFTLEKDRLLMEKCIKERESGINIAMEMTATTLRLTTGENARLKKEINFRRLQTNKLISRYEIELLKAAQPAGGQLENQTFYVVKAMEEMEELKNHGDQLDAEINQSEKELEALQNTLSLMKESNRVCENNHLDAESDLVQKRDTHEQSCKELKSAAHRRKKQLVSIRIKVEELQLALDAAEQELAKTQLCGNELQTSTSKLKQSISILNQRILRATRCLTKSKRAALQHMQKVGDLSETEIRADIELQLKRDLNGKLVALTMSQLRSKKDQKGVEAHARAYFAAANIITDPWPSWAPSRDTIKLLSGAPPVGTSCPSAAAITSPTTARSAIPQRLNLSEASALPGEPSSRRGPKMSERSSRNSCG
ncbi:Coiled-coil domain-containing protein 39 [Taenia crassiceps]|uniref:Coiled-coil domain-containing protein 39 n=1 Tax=Taenia crassiceps TaxID=6207 RepID=A0ABR4QTH6_9CEST